MSYRMSTVDRILGFMREAAYMLEPGDPAQGVVAIDAGGALRFGHVLDADTDLVILAAVARDGSRAPFQDFIVTDAIRGFRYADLDEPPHRSYR